MRVRSSLGQYGKPSVRDFPVKNMVKKKAAKSLIQAEGMTLHHVVRVLIHRFKPQKSDELTSILSKKIFNLEKMYSSRRNNLQKKKDNVTLNYLLVFFF